jgi:hypothetical protein
MGMLNQGVEMMIIVTMFSFFLVFFFFLLCLIWIGSFLEKKDIPTQILLGFSFFSGLGFILGKLNLFSPWIWGSLLGGGILLFHKKFWETTKKICQCSITLSLKEILWGSLVGAITILNILQSFFPFSLGWDSANEYLLITKVLAENKQVLTGVFPSFVNVFLSFPTQILGISGAQFFLSLGGLGLWLSIIWFGQKLHLKKSFSILVATTFFLIPAVQFQLSRDLKPDIFFVTFLLMGLGIFIFSRKLISAFLLGFSALLKLTATWFFPFLMIIIVFLRTQWKQKIVSLFLLVLPLGIWMGINFGETKIFDTWTLLKGTSTVPTFVLESKPALGTSFSEEVERYGGINIWDIFRSQGIPNLQKQYTDLGFWWLAILPLLFISFFQAFQKKQKKHLILCVLTLGFLLFWIFCGKGIAWYGFPGLILLLLISTRYIQNLEKFPLLHTSLLGISIVFGVFSRLEQSYQHSFAASVSWAASSTQENQESLENRFFSEEKKVAHILNQDVSANIYRIGTLIKFWILNPSQRIFNDAQLDIFMQLESDVLRKFQEKNFTYIIFDRATDSIEKNPKGTLHHKVDTFLEFAKYNLKEVFRGERLILFEIPRN